MLKLMQNGVVLATIAVADGVTATLFDQPLNTAPPPPAPDVANAPGSSELAIVLTEGAPHFGYVNGVLTDLRTNQPVPTAAHDPMPTDWGTGTVDDQVRRLLQWQADHAWMGRQLVIDGNPAGQAGDTSQPLRFTTAGGKLALENNVPPPEAPVVVVVPAVEAGPSIVDISALHGQDLFRFAGDFQLVYHNLRPPVVVGRLGFVKAAAQEGGDTLAGTLEVTGGDRPMKGGTAGSVFFSVGEHVPDEGLNFADGADARVTGTGIEQPVIVDVRTADF